MLRFDETSLHAYNGAMDSLVRRIQRAYPQIYLACHVEHTTHARDHGLSERDARVLAHLDELAPVGVSDLARHLGVGLSTVSEAAQRLEALGLLERRQAPRDRRGVELRLTAAGLAHMQASSVLDPARIATILARLAPRERSAAVRGLELLARASRDTTAAAPRRPRAKPRTRRPS
jgi:DNA-binding MarR family transcriptional regulator